MLGVFFYFFGRRIKMGKKLCELKNRDIYRMSLWGARELMEDGFSRTMSYQLLSRDDVPVVVIGRRRFVYREAFQEWLKKQADKTI